MSSNSRRASGVQLHQRLSANSVRRRDRLEWRVVKHLLPGEYPLNLLVTNLDTGVVVSDGLSSIGESDQA